MRIVFMGTPTFAVNSLDKLVKKEYDVALVVTQPDKPKGRGKKIIFSDIKNYALNNNLNIFQPKTLKDISVVEKIRELNPDLFVTAAYGNILTKEILDIPKFGCINVHASILPKYR
ncbi:MAG: methionyl-tRNA formyltransferase, partial [Clostridiales bacterium]